MPYFNSETGAMDPASPDLVTGATAPHAELDRQQQEARALREAIGTGKPPAGPSEAAPALPPGFPALATAAELEQFRAEYLADPWHPMRGNPALAEHYAQAVARLAGHDDGEEPLGTLHDGKILAPEDTPEVRVPALSEAAQAQGFTWDRELHEELVDATDASGLPRHHVEQVFSSVAEAAEALALDEDLNTVDAGLVGLLRTEGAARARQTIEYAQALLDRLVESGIPALIQASNSLAAVSNHPSVLRACATLYRELKNLPPQGPWEQVLLGGAAKWAQRQAEAQARSAKPDEAPPDHVVSTGGRA